MGISEAEFAVLKNRKVAANWRQRARGLTNHRRGEMTKAEAMYDQELAVMKAAGLIEWYAYESATFKLGVDARYTPDFMVMLADGTLEAVDVKGGGMVQEASMVRIRAFALQFPIRMVIATLQKNGGFERKEINGN